MKLKKKLKSYLPPALRKLKRRKRLDYFADGMGVRNKNISHLHETRFVEAWQFAYDGNIDGWNGSPPDIRWRASVCCWAAKNAMTLKGDFVECGVHTGLFSMTVCHYLDFQSLDRSFYLYDTFEGIPVEPLKGDDRQHAKEINDLLYFDCFDIAQRNFQNYKNVILIKGKLPDSLAVNSPAKIAYLSIDLNNASFEHQTIVELWERLVPGAIVVIDDFAFKGHEEQYKMWNEFASDKGTAVLPMPTGQGVIVKPPN